VDVRVRPVGGGGVVPPAGHLGVVCRAAVDRVDDDPVLAGQGGHVGEVDLLVLVGRLVAADEDYLQALLGGGPREVRDRRPRDPGDVLGAAVGAERGQLRV